MERNFYPENFEKFLKWHADQFKMTPSKKVWHGIYNDLHPGRRWPSVAMSMIFIFTLVIIGHLNTNNDHNSPLYDLNSLHGPNPANQTNVKKNFATSYKPVSIIANDPSNTLQISKNTQPFSSTTAYLPNLNGNTLNDVVLENKNENSASEKIEINVANSSPSDNSIGISSKNINDKSNKEMNPVKEQIPDVPVKENTTNIRKPKGPNSATWTYYATPSLSYRSFSDATINNSVIHRPMMGYEAGTAMSLFISKKLRFTTGLQINYSGYRIQANNTHPIIATLELNNTTTGQSNVYTTMSHYGNSIGNEFTRLKNYNLQTSVPIGLEYVLAGNDKIKFNAAATFQPSFIINSRAYMLSTNKKNYMTNPELLRKWNMNTGLSTYASFNSNSLNWQIGPQIRYQLLSTYSNQYPVKERLINYGIRLGVSKGSK